MMEISEIIKMLNLSSDEDLLMSRKDCHITGLHSIVLYCDKFNRLTRLYLTTENHQLYNCIDDGLFFNLGVHNHRYDLHLAGVHGCAINIGYEKSKYELQKKIKVQSYVFYDREKFNYSGDVFLSQSSNKKIDSIFLNKDDLHTVFVEKTCTASWLVQEGFEQRGHTMLYTNKPVDCQKHTSFNSAADVRKFVIDYYENINKASANAS